MASRSNRRVYTPEEAAELQAHPHVRERMAWLKEHRGGGFFGTIRNFFSSVLGAARKISKGKTYQVSPENRRLHNKASLALYGVTRKEARALQGALENGVLRGISSNELYTLRYQVRTRMFRIFPKRAKLALNEHQKRELLSKAVEPGENASEEQKNAFAALKASFPEVTEILKTAQSKPLDSNDTQAQGATKGAASRPTSPAKPMVPLQDADPFITKLVETMNKLAETINNTPNITKELRNLLGRLNGFKLWNSLSSLQRYVAIEANGQISGVSSELSREMAIESATKILELINKTIETRNIKLPETPSLDFDQFKSQLDASGSTYVANHTELQTKALYTIATAKVELESIVKEAG